jgi:hypothetical protein
MQKDTCLFIAFLLDLKKEFKGKGYASSLIDECIKEAANANMHGVAVVTRKGPFMAKKDIFVKKGFVLVHACMRAVSCFRNKHSSKAIFS